jgi:1-acyl-sn-glycerol-3-phosphate acyltransferase
MVPPRLVRRIVLAPLLIVIAAAMVVLFPPLALLAVAFGLARGSWPGHSRSAEARSAPGPEQARASRLGRLRALRLLSFALIWVVAETAALFMCLALWITSGFGGRLRTEPYQSRHYAIMEWYLGRLYGAAVRTLGLRIEVHEPALTAGEQAARLARPVIVLSRHAGPGDSLLLVHHLLTVYHRRPRIVMKAALQLDPGLDVVAHRVPNVFISPQRAGEKIYTDQIRRLAAGLGRHGALVIFPEGGNWTPGRWRRGIRRLERQGQADLAARARDMPHLLPPRAGGALAALAACPSADVIFVGHAGLDQLASVADVWRALPIDHIVEARWWRVPADEVPRSADHEAQVRWLYDWWARIDAWISQNTPQSGALPPGSQPPGSQPPGSQPPGTQPPGTQPPGSKPLDDTLT